MSEVDIQRNAVPVGTPLLSVAVPYKDYPVETLASELILQSGKASAAIEIVFADDGSQDSRHAEALQALFAAAPVPCTLMRSARNAGRAAIRNRLARQAQGTYLLFLDADMLPDDEQFLQRYLDHARVGELDIVCGGRSYKRLAHCPESQALYRYFSQATECVGPEIRNCHALWYLLTNNLMLRRQLLLDQPFDESYRGWGFEDADWALRLRGVRALHIDNTASHMDLPDDRDLLAKYDHSTENFVRISRAAPEFHQLALYRASRLLMWAPVPAAVMRWLARNLALEQRLPMRLRYLGLHGYRAATYAGVMRGLLRPSPAPRSNQRP